MDAGAAIVGFVGVTGQILQGCAFLQRLISDAKDALATANMIRNELTIFEETVKDFRSLLLKYQEDASDVSAISAVPTAAALQSCQEAIDGLRQYLDKHTRISNSRNKLKDGWHRLGAAFDVDGLQKNCDRLERAKATLLAVQQNIQVSQVHQVSITGRDTKATLSDLYNAQRSSSAINAESKLLLDNVWTCQQRLSGAAADTNTSLLGLSGDLGAGLRYAASSERYAKDARDTALDTRQAMVELTRGIMEKFDGLPLNVTAMLEGTIRSSIGQHQIRVENDLTAPGGSHMSRQRDDLSHQVNHPDIPRGAALDKAATDVSLVVSSRGRRRQKRCRSTYRNWFGKLGIETLHTQQEELYTEIYLLSATRTSITITPSLWFLKYGATLQLGQMTPTLGDPARDLRFKIFNIVTEESPIARAIDTFDYMKICQLLQGRRATPFDVVRSPFGHEWNLITRLYQSWDPSRDMDAFLAILALLSSSGADCAETTEWLDVLLATDAAKREEGRGNAMCHRPSFLTDFLRLIIRFSHSNPFQNLLCIQRLYPPANTMILGQDEWDLSQIKSRVQQRWGRNAWDRFVVQGEYLNHYLHEQEQILRWQQQTKEFRRSEAACLDEFGEIFTSEKWPVLCWKEELPAFWWSKDACLAEYGHWFVKWSGPTLRWKVEKPAFWKSREACQKEYGHDFSRRIWPRLVWEEEKPSFWRSRKRCEEAFGWYFLLYYWPWLCWKEKRPSFWKSRSACMKQFGVHFARHNWPSLAWQEMGPALQRCRAVCCAKLGENFVRSEWPALLGPTIFEQVEGRGSWHGLVAQIYNTITRKEWAFKLEQAWRAEEPTFRRSKEACRWRFGSSFIAEQWPRLLAEEGVDVPRTTNELESIFEDAFWEGFDQDPGEYTCVDFEPDPEYDSRLDSSLTSAYTMDHSAGTVTVDVAAEKTASQVPGAWPGND